MEQIVLNFLTEHLDTYSLVATILTAILAIIVPILKAKCSVALKKLETIHAEVEKLLTACKEAYADKKISADELKTLVDQAILILEKIKKIKG